MLNRHTLRRAILTVCAYIFSFAVAVGDSARAQSSSASVPVCHVPAPRTPGPQTLLLPETAAMRHEDHGDHSGACSPPPNSCTATTLDARVNFLLPEFFRVGGEVQEAQQLARRFG